MALGQFGGIMGIIYYASHIFESAGFSTTVWTIAVATVQIPVTSVGVFLMYRLGRRPLLLPVAVLRVWNVPRLHFIRIVIPVQGSWLVNKHQSKLGVRWDSVVYCSISYRNGRNTLHYNVRGVSHKCKRHSRELSHYCQLRHFLECFICFQLHV